MEIIYYKSIPKRAFFLWYGVVPFNLFVSFFWFPIDLEPNRRLFGSKSIGNVQRGNGQSILYRIFLLKPHEMSTYRDNRLNIWTNSVNLEGQVFIHTLVFCKCCCSNYCSDNLCCKCDGTKRHLILISFQKLILKKITKWL